MLQEFAFLIFFFFLGWAIKNKVILLNNDFFISEIFTILA